MSDQSDIESKDKPEIRVQPKTQPKRRGPKKSNQPKRGKNPTKATKSDQAEGESETKKTENNESYKNLQAMLNNYSKKQTSVPIYDNSSQAGGSDSDDGGDIASFSNEQRDDYQQPDYEVHNYDDDDDYHHQYDDGDENIQSPLTRNLPADRSEQRSTEQRPREPAVSQPEPPMEQSTGVNVRDEFQMGIQLPEQLPDFQPDFQPNYQSNYHNPPPPATPNRMPRQNPQLRVTHKSNRLNHNITKLRTVTYNLWFQKYDLLPRTNSVIRIILEGQNAPDVVAFQEATVESYNLIKKRMGSKYIMFDTLGDPPAPYGTVLAINRETLELDEESLAYYDFPETGMGRKLMTCQVTHRRTQTPFHILNTHLESLNENWKMRKVQLNFILNIIKAEKIQNLVLLGDFNICDEREPIESQIKYSGLKDAWVEMGSPQSLKNTYDYRRNQLVKGKFQSRLDRILYRFTDGEVVVVKFRLLGVKEPPSDHFGVGAEFLIKKE